jgi:precorrin-6A/cobalt-precorrin-6A reductase
VTGPVRVLLLGGTSEASALAKALAGDPRFAVITSLAGRTAEPRLPPGRTRIGGFGGVDGLAGYLREERIDALVDATHPFAAVMPWHALEAARLVGVPRVRVRRPGWTAGCGDRWHRVPDLAAAARMLETLGSARVFLTTGRQELAPFATMTGVHFLLRSIETPEVPDGLTGQVLLARPPFTVDAEVELLVTHRIDALVTKDSGAEATSAKLVAAREVGVPVVIVDRPPSPRGPIVATVDAALAWLAASSSTSNMT